MLAPAISRVCGAVAMICLAIGLAGCGSMGPNTVPTDKFDYNGAIAEAQQQELLLNLVRLRYREPPVFLKVSSVISQYSRTASTSATAGINTGLTGNDTASADGRLGWSDRPVITYTPVSGQEFSRNLLTPLNLRAIFRLSQSGWSPRLVFRTSTMSFNGLENDRARLSSRQQGNPGLFELMRIWQRLRVAGVLDVGQRGEANTADLVLFVNPTGAEDAKRDLARFRELLALSPDVNEYRVVQGLLPRSQDEIAVLTGSIWDIMLNLAWQFEVPPEHVSSGRTGPAFRSIQFEGEPPIKVMNSAEEPGDAYAKAFTQNRWFYIENTDMASKQAFSFLQLLLSLAETEASDRGPVLTISN
jgi:hypothetical protein